MKKLKNKNIILGLIAILVVMSVGFVVNSYYNTREQGTENTYSEAMEHVFKSNGSDFDGIVATQKLKPNEQYFDGMPDKEATVLVSKNMVINKKTHDERDLNDVAFFFQKDTPDAVIMALGKTSCGKLPVNENNFKIGSYKILESENTTGTIAGKNTTINLKPIEVSVFKDPQVRLLGEADGNNFITYEKLIKSFNNLEGITPINNTENKWLKVWDKREGKLLYIAKQPIATVKNFSNLVGAGVVYGLDKVPPNPITEAEGIINITDDKGNTIKYQPNIVTINNKKYIVRMLKGRIKEVSREWSEWDRYIISLLKTGRGKQDIDGPTRDLLEKVKNSNNKDVYRLKMGEYSWEDISNLDYKEYVQEGQTRTAVETDSSSTFVYRPVLEEFKCYDGACFEGEVAGTDFITYKKLYDKIDEDYTNQNGKTYKSLNKTSSSGDAIESPIGNLLGLGNDKDAEGSWLKIFDAREGKTLYIAKKPITNNVSWNMLVNAGVVYGLDQIDVSKIQADGTIKSEAPYTGALGYKPKIIKIKDSSGTEKKYIVRLLKGHTTDSKIHKNGDPNTITPNKLYYGITITKDSEWNRYILPLVKDYRYGSGINSYKSIEDELKYLTDNTKEDLLLQPSLSKDNKNYKIQLEKYNWFGDLTLRPYESTFYYKGIEQKSNDLNNIFYKNIPQYVGQYSWTQEYAEDTGYRALRGASSTDYGAAYANSYYPDYSYSYCGFRPVLEEIPNP